MIAHKSKREREQLDDLTSEIVELKKEIEDLRRAISQTKKTKNIKFCIQCDRVQVCQWECNVCDKVVCLNVQCTKYAPWCSRMHSCMALICYDCANNPTFDPTRYHIEECLARIVTP